MDKQKVMEKLDSLFKEELWGRIEPKDIGISKFKILDDIFNTIVSEDLVSETIEVCKAHLTDHNLSITAIYLTGLIGYHRDSIEDSIQLRKLIDVFTNSHKWAVVQLIAEKILEYGENSFALRALAIALERLGRNREAIPVLEDLLKVDRFDADVAKKLANAIMDDDPQKSVHYMKLSIEGFIKNERFDEVPVLWNKLVSLSWDDIVFFERIERLLVEAKQSVLAANLLKQLLNKYRDSENPDQTIILLKKILEYTPDDTHARRELINFYGYKYKDHSQFEQFMKLSRLANFKVPVKLAIQDFEKNIVFDKDNYVFHNSWKVGRIIELDSERIIIKFRDKPEHAMSIQMALQSLTPVSKDHIYVMDFDDPETLKSLFEEDFISFFEVLIKSYSGRISLADIKREIVPKYLEEKNWSKWWSRARTMIKKDSRYGISDKKKDMFVIRDKPLTFADELLGNFTKSGSFAEKLDIAIEFINNIDRTEGESVVGYFIDYFSEEAKGDSPTRQLLSFFLLDDMSRYSESSKLKLDPIRERVIGFIRQSQDLSIISMKISSYDYKKNFVNLIEKTREDWPGIISGFLFETPVRIHKYILNSLIRAHAYNVINGFIDRVITGAKQYPEIFIWVSRNIFNKTWDYDWLDYSRETLAVTYFRLMNELKKIELEGNRLKNLAIEVLFANEATVIREICTQFDKEFLGRIFDLFRSISYIEQSQSDRLLSIIREKYPEFQAPQATADLEWKVDVEKHYVSKGGYEKMKAELDRLVNAEMVKVTRELSLVSDASADQRENVEYNALLEKQSILELSISKLDNEIKKAVVLDDSVIATDAVNIGTRVVLEDISNGGLQTYTILGPWDADFEKTILSYRSPIAGAILGHRQGEEVDVRIEDDIRKYRIKSITKYSQ